MRKHKKNRKHSTISKFLSYVLRHRPDRIGLRLDPNGWADVSELLQKAGEGGRAISPDVLREVVFENDKQRFTLDPENNRIRANQGHSVPIDLGLSPIDPPPVLFHGTAGRFLNSIWEKGLVSGSRQHVYLSPDAETAARVGQRHGKPAVLKISASQMASEGHLFYCSENGVWLTETVPSRFIEEHRQGKKSSPWGADIIPGLEPS